MNGFLKVFYGIEVSGSAKFDHDRSMENVKNPMDVINGRNLLNKVIRKSVPAKWLMCIMKIEMVFNVETGNVSTVLTSSPNLEE